MATKTTKKAPAKKATPKKKREPQPAPTEKLSQIAAAERVLAAAGEPMTCGEMVAAMTRQNLWSSPAGKTPAATLYASLLRLIRAKGKDAKFQKVARGKFTLNAEAQ
jgi:outer membrane biosynthesis protein TonB